MSHHLSQCQSISMFPKNHYVATSVFPYDLPFISIYTSYGGPNGLPGFPSHGFTMPFGCPIGRLGGAAPAQLGQFPIVSTMEFTMDFTMDYRLKGIATWYSEFFLRETHWGHEICEVSSDFAATRISRGGMMPWNQRHTEDGLPTSLKMVI